MDKPCVTLREIDDSLLDCDLTCLLDYAARHHRFTPLSPFADSTFSLDVGPPPRNPHLCGPVPGQAPPTSGAAVPRNTRLDMSFLVACFPCCLSRESASDPVADAQARMKAAEAAQRRAAAQSPPRAKPKPAAAKPATGQGGGYGGEGMRWAGGD